MTDHGSDPFQVMPPLTAEERTALREDIEVRGVLVPVLVDQHGRTLDGHHRQAIAAELGLDCPTETREVADDQEAREVALSCNLSRRHLTREQKRDLIARECQARPDDSDRRIARSLGCSPSTVAEVRRPSKLDTSDPTPAPTSSAPTRARRRPLPETARDAGWTLRKSIERVERLLADDRYPQNVEQVADALRTQLTYTAGVVASALDRLPARDDLARVDP